MTDLAQLAKRFAMLYTSAIAERPPRQGGTFPADTPEHDQAAPPWHEPGRGLRTPWRANLGRAADYDESIRATLEMLGAVPTGHVAIYQTNGEASAHLGELSVTSLKSRGVAGAVIGERLP